MAAITKLARAIALLVAGGAAIGASPASAAGPTGGAAANDVCAFVAAAYNRGDQDKLWGYPDPVDIAGDGKLRHVYIVEQGTAHVHSIIASTAPLSTGEQEAASNCEVNFYGSIGQDMSLDTVPRIFQFKGAYYVIYEGDGGPYDVVKPNTGELCRFKRHYSAVLSENRGGALCAAAVGGKQFKKLPTQKLADAITVDDASTLNLPGPFSPSIARYADVKLDPAAAAVRVGYFKYESSAGAGCQAAGVVFLNGNAIENSPRNTALLAAQAKMTDCRGSDGFVISAGGQNLVEIDGGTAEQRKSLPRILLRLVGNNVQTVCQVEQKATFTPAAAGKAP